MKLMDETGCLTSEALAALLDGTLDEPSRLEAAEHLAYCNDCMDRYTLLLSGTALETPPKPIAPTVRQCLWVRAMQSRLGRGAVACAAAVLAFGMWSGCRSLSFAPGSDAAAQQKPAVTAPPSQQFWADARHPRNPNDQAVQAAEKVWNTLKTAGGSDHEK